MDFHLLPPTTFTTTASTVSTPLPDLVSDSDSDSDGFEGYDRFTTTMPNSNSINNSISNAKCTLSQMAIGIISDKLHTRYTLFGSVEGMSTIIGKFASHFNFTMIQLVEMALLLDTQLNTLDGIPSEIELKQLLFQNMAFVASKSKEIDMLNLQRISGIDKTLMEREFFNLKRMDLGILPLDKSIAINDLKSTMGKYVKLI